MATMLPPIRSASFAFDIGLVSTASTNIFTACPTLAVGDVKLVGDGIYVANTASLPVTTSSANWLLTQYLSASEMDYAKVSVSYRDQSGGEWQDALVSIYTTASSGSVQMVGIIRAP